MVEARFQVYQDVAHKYRFRLRAANNKIVTVGEAYESKQGCLKGINAVKKYCNSPIEDLSLGEEKISAPKFQMFKDRNEKYRFHLIAPNYEIVAVSEAYETKAGCLNGINSVKNNCGAGIEDLTPSARKVAPSMDEGVVSARSTSTKEILSMSKNDSQLYGTENVDPSSRNDRLVVLNEPPKTAEEGSKVIFTGKLLKASEGVGGQKINMYESDRSFMQDDFMGSGETGADGSFSITWVAKKMDWWDDTVEVYARYMDEERRLIHIRSETFVVKIV